MKIALIGYGKMGRLVEQIALQREHEVLARIDSATGIVNDQTLAADIWIDFSHPTAAINTIRTAVKHRKNLVMGTSGWYDELDTVKNLINSSEIGFIYSPNFSIGVQLFMQIVAQAASLLNPHSEYDAAITEAHHRQKVDSPSGTATAISDQILENMPRKNTLVTGEMNRALKPGELHLSSIRCGKIPGTHTVVFDSLADSITLTHEARNREGFASGAVSAAEWLQDKKGFYTIQDLLEGVLR